MWRVACGLFLFLRHTPRKTRSPFLSPMAAIIPHIQRLPNDLLQNHLIRHFILGAIQTDNDIDSHACPLELFVLLQVNKWFNRLLKNSPLARKLLSNFTDLSVTAKEEAVGNILCTARSLPLIEWTWKLFPSPRRIGTIVEAAAKGSVRLLFSCVSNLAYLIKEEISSC